MIPGSHDPILAIARLAQAALLCVVLAATVRSRKHVPLALWLIGSLAYAFLAEYWLGPVLARLPRPYHGNARLLMHAGQALFLAVGAGTTALAWRAFRVRSAWLPLPFFVAFCALVVLVDGYGHSPGPGLYRIRSLVFRSNTVFTVAATVLAFMSCAGIVPRLVRVLLEPFDEQDTSFSVTSLVLLLPGVVRVATPFVWSDITSTRINSALIAIVSMISLGVYAALLTHAGRARWKDLVENQLMKVRRGRAIFRIAARMQDTERRLLEPRQGDPVAWRYIADLMRRAGREDTEERLLIIPVRRVVDLEQAASVTGTLRDLDALRVLANARDVLAASKLPSDAPVRIEQLIQLRSAFDADVMWSPVTLMLFSSMQGTLIGAADSVFAELEALHREAHRRGCTGADNVGIDHVSSPGG